MKSRNKGRSMIGVLMKLIPEAVKSAPVMFSVDIVICLLHGISWGAIAVVQQMFFDKAVLLTIQQTDLYTVLKALTVLSLTYVICHFLNGFENFYSDVLCEKIKGKLSIKIHKKIANLPAIAFENANKLDDINKAENGKNNSVSVVVVIKDLGTFYLPYFIFMGWYLFSLKPILAFSIVLVFIPTALTQIIRTKLFDVLEDDSAPIRRENEYYESCIVSREYFKETRMLGAVPYFKNLYINSLNQLQRLRYKATMRSNKIELCMQLITVSGYIGILFLLFHALIRQEVSVGAFAAVFSSISMMYENMEEIVCEQIGEVAEGLGNVKNYINFLEMEETTGMVDKDPGWGDIVAKNVSFTYPEAKTITIKNVSFTLKKGETTAIVGLNGSGKSTMVRLLTGLYFPDEGSITINGINTKSLTKDCLYKNTSGVFQKYQHYQMTLEENITLSSSDKEYKEELLDQICEMSGVEKDSASYPNKYKTLLSKEFGGVEISGGQWQRIAIARGFFRDHNFIVLDEPTAAIDPYEETRIYNQFAEISKTKSAIIVTHRIGTVKLADRILVMKDGSIEEMGTHDELMSNNREYKRLYETQEQWYKQI